MATETSARVGICVMCIVGTSALNWINICHCFVVPLNRNTRPGRDIGSCESLESYDFKELLILLAQFL